MDLENEEGKQEHHHAAGPCIKHVDVDVDVRPLWLRVSECKQSLRPTPPVWALCLWTVVLWLSRLRNVLADDDLDRWGVGWRVLVVAVFVASAALAFTGRGVGWLVAWTLGFWVVRGGGILLDDHDAAFKAIHSALMVVSIGLAMWVWQAPER